MLIWLCNLCCKQMWSNYEETQEHLEKAYEWDNILYSVRSTFFNMWNLTKKHSLTYKMQPTTLVLQIRILTKYRLPQKYTTQIAVSIPKCKHNHKHNISSLRSSLFHSFSCNHSLPKRHSQHKSSRETLKGTTSHPKKINVSKRNSLSSFPSGMCKNKKKNRVLNIN